MTDWNQFTGRKRDLCRGHDDQGRAVLTLERCNAYRKLWGLPPLERLPNGVQVAAAEPQPYVGCGGCQKRKRWLNSILPGAGDAVEWVTKTTGIKTLADRWAARKRKKG